MAAKEQNKNKIDDSKKRKRGPDTTHKKAFNKGLNKNIPGKDRFEKSNHDDNKTEPKSKRQVRINQKELTEARKKKRKPHYTLEQELALLWEKMRRRNITKEDKSKLATVAIQKMKGTICEIAVSHVSSRVLQTCVKNCSQAERDIVLEEIRPHLLTLSRDTYAVHLVKKILDTASKNQLEGCISSLHGHVASLLRHMVGSVVVEHAYQLANSSQKQSLLSELYSVELQLFKDLASTKEKRLIDIIPKLGLNKASVQRHMASVIQPILEKGILDHSIIHSALIEYLSIADKSSAADVVKQLSGPLLVRMIHTKGGAKLGMLCVKHGSAKERKKIIKGMKGHIGKIANDQYGNTVLGCILSVVDDTKLITKIVIRELQTVLKELVLDKNGRRPLLQLLHPNCPHYAGIGDLASPNLSIPSLCSKGEGSEVNLDLEMEVKLPEVAESCDKGTESDKEEATVASENPKEHGQLLVDGGKKDPSLRRFELLVKSGLAESLVDTCIESAGELLLSNFGKDVIYEVATGGVGGVLHPSVDEKLVALYEAIATLASLPKSSEEAKKDDHVLENFHSSRIIRKLVLDCSAFASTLWKSALEGKCQLWAQGHSSKVISAFLESSDSKIRDMTKSELQPLVDNGLLKIRETKLAGKEG
ncbi:hypothetical protein GIB67_021875 [Kingdonia uniflora]|uniref:PUM-HD domain-containing protein n=1 Tax=Kingdonia uniflora TaxID=39325 RepID=A0A7J7NEJ9_9MAGN|nr:hypothetical protein GIB67_021875 [Kingdonia uniflora]